jgi:hypothetical protein
MKEIPKTHEELKALMIDFLQWYTDESSTAGLFGYGDEDVVNEYLEKK